MSAQGSAEALRSLAFCTAVLVAIGLHTACSDPSGISDPENPSLNVECPAAYPNCYAPSQMDTERIEMALEMLPNPNCEWVGEVIGDYLYSIPPLISVGDLGGYDGWYDSGNGAMMIDFDTFEDIENLAYTLIHEVRHYYNEWHNGGYFDDEYDVADPCFEAL